MGQAIGKSFFRLEITFFVALLVGVCTGCRRLGEAFLEHDGRVASPLAAFAIPVPAGRAGNWLAGDFHCHVRPPDGPREVRSDFDDTVTMARAGGLDFVVLVPHVRGKFYEDAANRKWVAEANRRLTARARSVSDIVVVPGVEYTDGDSGHIGVSFVDLADVLDAREPFFEAVVRQSGILNIHHPYALPMSLPFYRRGLPDMSWRPFTRGTKIPREIAFVNDRYSAIEVFNHSKSVVDRVVQGDRFIDIRRALAKADTEVVRRGHPIALIGGSDNHAFSLRATTYVFAETRDGPGIANAVRGAHTCAMGPDACTFQVRSSVDRRWRIVGDVVKTTTGDAGWIEARWRGDGTLVANGERIYRGRGPVRLRVTGDSYLRLETATSFSSHIAIRMMR
ncbi:MAG: hypothetical protein HYY84_09265 [Deltaproteobacteria bacterium]|nr:hypothetical protein [Deltaproteobacteria bacterium]